MKMPVMQKMASGRCKPAGSHRPLAAVHRPLAAGTLLISLVLASIAPAAEISSNGIGGGPWSDPNSWSGKKAPGPDDDVIIRKLDVIVFDRGDDGKPTCKRLQIDPKGGLTFKSGAGKLALTVPEGIETFGPIRLDGTRSASDLFTIRLAGDKEDKRHLKLGRGGALLLFGRAALPENGRNVVLSVPQLQDSKETLQGLVDAEGAVMIDWQRVRIEGVKLSARQIDNTGAKANERVRVVECQFTGPGRLHCLGCDTPEISRNTFDYKGPTVIPEPAVHLHTSPLAEVKGNTVRGLFHVGLGLYAQSDCVVTDTVVEKCNFGLSGGYGLPNLMVKQLIVRGCESGVRLEGTSGVVEDAVVEGALTAYQQTNSTVQIVNLQVKDLAKKGGLAVLHEGGSLTLQNCNILPAEIKVVPQPPAADGKPRPIPVVCQQCLVIRVKDAPAGARVEIRTANPALPAGAADPNVRNSPVALVNGLTPGPASLSPLLVRAWSLDLAGKPLPAPEYAVKILGIPAKEGAERPVLKTVLYRPPENAFRAPAAELAPTLEVSVK
jgi:hypothetical protein